MSCCAIFAAVVFHASASTKAQRSGIVRLRLEHRAAVESFLARKRRDGVNLRLTGEGDFGRETVSRVRSEPRRLRYNPFYATGDFNRDGQEDFAVLLRLNNVPQEASLAVAVFNGPFRNRSTAREAFYNAGFQADDMLFFIRRQLLIGPYQSDNCFIFRPRRRTYRLTNCLTMMTDWISYRELDG